MGRATIILNTPQAKATATAWIAKAPPETVVTFKRNKRSIPQNDRMWAMLAEVSTQLQWHGLWLDSEAWKLIFLDALKRELRMVPNLDGTGLVQLGRSTSDLTKEEQSGLMELISAFGAQHGVTFRKEAA
mgnify:CR=1 FL=1